jgi:DNA polymerase-3 subunit epsilon
MTLISDSNFIVVDVETTGNNAVDGRMTEVGSIVVRDFQIVDTYTSLINPHQFIPWNIQRVTGISNKMVANAPEEYEISQKIYEHFSNPNPLFVAHNVDFDWSFISETLNRTLGVSIDIPKICTLKLARKLLPN